MPKKREEAQEGHHQIEEKILENLVALQKVHADLAEKFGRLSEQMTGLLNLFENAARSFAQHPANQVGEKDKDFLEKIDKLLDQNKTIAKGLTLMEERIRGRVYGAPRIQNTGDLESTEENPPTSFKPLPKF